MPPFDLAETLKGAGVKSVAVIGAGAAGLCAAHYCQRAGFDVTVFEIGTRIGGMWCFRNDNGLSAAYRTLHINTAKSVTSFSDLPFSDEVPMFPSHWDMQTYFEQFADEFDLRRLIRFNTRVTSLTPLPSDARDTIGWRVELESGESEAFDFVIVANGHLHKPMHVDLFRTFTGQYLHSHDYKEPDPLVGKRVCIVGIGASACDIASDLAMVSPRVVLVARSGVRIVPKLIFGRPFTEITHKLTRAWIPARVRRSIVNALIYLMHGSMTDLGFKPITVGTHGLSSATIVTHIAYRRVIVKTGIDRIEGQRITFADGTSEQFDALVSATGYLLDIPFISDDVVAIENNAIDLFCRVFPVDRPHLYFLGYVNVNTAANQAYERQMQMIVDVEAGNVELPPPDEMRAAIKKKYAWISRQYKATPRHTLEEEWPLYFSELRKASIEGRRRARRRKPRTSGCEASSVGKTGRA